MKDNGLRLNKISKKTKIIAVASTCAIIGIAIPVCVLLLKKNIPTKDAMSNVSVDVVIPTNPEDSTPNDYVDSILADSVQGSGRVPFSYNVPIPKGLKELEPMDIKINGEGRHYFFVPNNEIIPLTKNDTFDFYNRVYEIKEKKCYLFVSEYLGTIKFPYGAQLGMEQENVAKEVSNWIVKESLKEKFGFTPVMDIGIRKKISSPDEDKEVWNLFSDFRIQGSGENNKLYYKGVMATGYENPVFVWCVDLTEDNTYADDLDQLMSNIGHSMTFKTDKGG